MQQYKALMLDLDGTTIPNHPDGKPSKKIQEAIKKAQEHVHVCVATSRPLSYATAVIELLQLTSPCIIDGGAQIYDPVKKKILAEQQIENTDVNTIWKFLKTNQYRFKYSNGTSQKELPQEHLPTKVLDFIIVALTNEQADEMIDKLSHISTLSLHKILSWTKGEFAVKISHATATKLHGIQTVSEMLHLKHEDMIGVGDSYNDFPLLMACGLKVAMKNAVSELKAIADYIAPSVEDDGLADVIEKYILKPN